MKNAIRIVFKAILVFVIIWRCVWSSEYIPIRGVIHSEVLRHNFKNGGYIVTERDLGRDFVVLVLIRSARELYRCTASIISNRWVVTSAGCFYERNLNPKDILIVGGKLDLSSYVLKRYRLDFQMPINENEFGVQEYRVQYYRIHPIFDSHRLYHDIVLLKTKSEFGNRLKPIRIATKKMNKKRNCTTIGYGFSIKFEAVLKSASSIEVSTTELGCNFKSKGLFLCLYFPASGECVGESGSPVMCGNSIWGIASFGMKSGDIKTQKECGHTVEMYYSALYFDKDWIASVINRASPIKGIESWWWLHASLLLCLSNIIL